LTPLDDQDIRLTIRPILFGTMSVADASRPGARIVTAAGLDVAEERQSSVGQNHSFPESPSSASGLAVPAPLKRNRRWSPDRPSGRRDQAGQ
jgi:hypothetical protein